ncbi:hypothetical protein DFJ73DRAFT_487273 [Zopfochytrium polystomum]|nr:hypothetical protein DFJ73DRAFT_487273 [Zopfochytrium polystomum]
MGRIGCQQRYNVLTKRKEGRETGLWSQSEDLRLCAAALPYADARTGTVPTRRWRDVAAAVGTRDAVQCQKRFRAAMLPDYRRILARTRRGRGGAAAGGGEDSDSDEDGGDGEKNEEEVEEEEEQSKTEESDDSSDAAVEQQTLERVARRDYWTRSNDVLLLQRYRTVHPSHPSFKP